MLVLSIFDQSGFQDPEQPSPSRGCWSEDHPSPSSPEDKETNMKKRRGEFQEELAVGYGRVRSKGQCTLNRTSPEAGPSPLSATASPALSTDTSATATSDEGGTTGAVIWPRWRSPLVRHSSSSNEENEQRGRHSSNEDSEQANPAEEEEYEEASPQQCQQQGSPSSPLRAASAEAAAALAASAVQAPPSGGVLPPPPPPPAAGMRRASQRSAPPPATVVAGHQQQQQQYQHPEEAGSPGAAAVSWAAHWRKKEEVDDCNTASLRKNLDKDFQTRALWFRKAAEADFHAPIEAATWETSQAQSCPGQQESQNQQELQGQPGVWGEAGDPASEQPWYDKALWEPTAEDFNQCHTNWHQKSGWSEPPQDLQSAEVNWNGPEELQPQQDWSVWCENEQELHGEPSWAGWWANSAEVQGHDASWRADGSQQHPSTWQQPGEQPSDDHRGPVTTSVGFSHPRPQEAAAAGYAKPLPKSSGGWYDDPGHIQSSGNGWFGSEQQDNQTLPGWGEGAEDFYRHQLSWS